MSLSSQQSSSRAGGGGAPLLLTNGRVVTLDAASTVQEAMVVQGNRILACGSDAQMRAAAGPYATEIDLKGHAVIPGMIDTHAHMDREGLKGMGPSLAGCRTADDVLDRVRTAVAAAQPGEWIVTMPLGDPPFYWNGEESVLRAGLLPTRHDLDRVAPRNPVYIRPIWGFWRHAPNAETLISVANTLALAATGIGPGSIMPSPNVEWERDAAGELTGVCVERTRSPMIELLMLDKASRFSPAQRQLGMRRAMEQYNAFGTTGVFEGHGVAAEVFKAFKACAREHPLNVRARLVHSPSWSSAGNADLATLVAQWAYWTSAGGLGDPFLSLDGFFVDHRPSADDVFRAQAAPYTGWAGHYYDSSLPLAQLKPVLLAAARQDVRCVAINSGMIDVLADIDREVPLAGRRWVVQHIGKLTPAQCETAARLGLVLAPLTARHIYKEGRPQESVAGSAGAEDHMPLARLMDMGVKVTLASDNAPPSLFHAYWHTVARRNRHGELVHPAAQKLTREQALRAATQNGAYLTFEEDERGTLEVGKLADLAVMSDDPLTCDEAMLPELRSLLTVVDGRIVHRDATVL
jgi:predicted amidohydrolase YtcJ